jgi:hypothetical protein
MIHSAGWRKPAQTGGLYRREGSDNGVDRTLARTEEGHVHEPATGTGVPLSFLSDCRPGGVGPRQASAAHDGE